MKKRFLAVVAMAAMLVAMMPSMVFGADETVTTQDELEVACGTSGTVKLGSNIELQKMISIGEGAEVVVDLNGYKLTGPDVPATSSYYALKAGAKSKLTLIDSSTEKTGLLYAKCYGVYIRDGGTFVMESGKIDATNNKSFGSAVTNYGGNVIVNGGTLIGYQWAINTESFTGPASTVVNGGTLENISNTEGAITLGGENSGKGAESVVIKGGTFKGPKPLSIGVGATADANISVEGGQFPVDSDIDDFLAKGYEVDDEGKVVPEQITEPTVPSTPADPEDSSEKPGEEPADSVDTGDNTNVVIPFVIAALVLAAMGAVVATRRRDS